MAWNDYRMMNWKKLRKWTWPDLKKCPRNLSARTGAAMGNVTEDSRSCSRLLNPARSENVAGLVTLPQPYKYWRRCPLSAGCTELGEPEGVACVSTEVFVWLRQQAVRCDRTHAVFRLKNKAVVRLTALISVPSVVKDLTALFNFAAFMCELSDRRINALSSDLFQMATLFSSSVTRMFKKGFLPQR
jgi:hypothetical protein